MQDAKDDSDAAQHKIDGTANTIRRSENLRQQTEREIAGRSEDFVFRENIVLWVKWGLR